MSFRPYDDEGYVLVSVREFLAGGALYDDVFSQYGPAYYAYKHLLSLVQGLPTHDIVRWTTLGVWLSSATLLGLAALRLTKSAVAGLVVFSAMVVSLEALRNEPGHPQELAIGLIALSVFVASSPLRVPTRVVLLTTIASVGVMTKINIGVFIALATLLAALPLGPGPARTVTALALACLPVVLMSQHLAEWAWRYAAVCSAGILTSVVMSSHSGLHFSSMRKLWPIVAAAVLPALALITYLLIRDSSLAAIINAVFIRPAEMPDAVVEPFEVSGKYVALSVAVAGFAMLTGWRKGAVPSLTPLVSALKVGVGLYVIFWLGNHRAAIVAQSALVAFALLIPDRSREPDERFGRVFLAASAAWHACTAYPMPGSQVSWSSFLVTFAAFVCVWDGLASPRSAIAAGRGWHRVAATAAICVGWALYDRVLTPLRTVEAEYRAHVPLPYEGATSTRATAAQVATFNWLVANLQGHCSDFVSLPGYNSLHIWSGIRPLTGHNLSPWMLVLNDEEQMQIVRRMQGASRPCAVSDEAGVKIWTNRPIADRPLVAHIFGLATVARRRGVELRVPAEHARDWTFEYLLAGRRTFDGGRTYLGLAESLTESQEGTLRLWFRTNGGGAMIGLQSGLPPHRPASWCPVIYVGRDGRLRAGLCTGDLSPLTSASRLDDGRWHHVALVMMPARQLLYVDGVPIGETARIADARSATVLQLGTGFTASWPESNGSWFPFVGDLRDVVVAARAWTPAEVLGDHARGRVDTLTR